MIATTDQVPQNDLDIIKTIVDIDNIEVVWVGDSMTTHTSCDLQIREITGMKEAVGEIKKLLQRKSIIFKPI